MFETAPHPEFETNARRPLEGKRLLITGVITHRSIAYAVAERAQTQGAEVLLTGFGRAKRLTERTAKRLDVVPDVLELDVNEPRDLELLTMELGDRWGHLDGVLHAIAFAPEDALGGAFMRTPPESAELAFRTSAYSMKALAAAVTPLMDQGGSIVGLDFDASVAWPVYDWMGVSKAALEAVNRYLCRDLGPIGMRSNLVSAGPIETAAAGGIPGFGDLAAAWQRRAPLGWDPTDAGPVADAVCFLLSDAARGISGQIVRVDGGFSALGTETPEV
ncbi:MAG: enoyl-ACP reductase FabI [Thermoleophilia bacterium]|nr:enoyl-ACP reductase FabI [Thermoleophilia bacterium]